MIWVSCQNLVRARAWTISKTAAAATTPLVAVIHPSRNHICANRSFLPRYSAENDNEENETKAPRTGWLHNKPSAGAPNSWTSSQQPNGAEKTGRALQPEESSNSDEPRTGWLHNTKPAQQSRKEAKKEASVSRETSSAEESSARLQLELAMKKKERNHRIISPPAFHACGPGRQVVVTEHMISVPLSRRTTSSSGHIDLYFSVVEVIKDEETRQWFATTMHSLSPQLRAERYVKRAALTNAKDMVLYLQGGPGFGAPTPITGLGFSKGSSWASKALDNYSRIVLMDQRGTGRSTPITKQTLEKRFPNLFVLDAAMEQQIFQSKSMDSASEGEASPPASPSKSMEEEVDSLLDSLLGDEGGDKSNNKTEKDDKPKADSKSDTDADKTRAEDTKTVHRALEAAIIHMSNFRADNIVLDAEDIRDALLMPSGREDPSPWGLALGQSYGGFCLMTYLSTVKNPPRVCLFTGGIAPMLTPAYQAYTSLWDRVKERSLRFYEMYPGDIAIVKEIVKKLLDDPADLPSGGTLTARRFLQLGLGLGGSPAAFTRLHETLASAFVQSDGDELEFTRSFLKAMDSEQVFDDHPIYFWLHESIYADGPKSSPTKWAAHRAYEDIVKKRPEFDYVMTSRIGGDTHPTLFFGEMIFPWMTEDYAELGGLGMTALANALAAKSDWGPLYNASHMRKVLEDGKSKAAAAVYYEDMYVDFDASMKVTTRGGPLEKCKVWVTNDYQHSGLRDNGAEIFEKLHSMALGGLRTPS